MKFFLKVSGVLAVLAILYAYHQYKLASVGREYMDAVYSTGGAIIMRLEEVSLTLDGIESGSLKPSSDNLHLYLVESAIIDLLSISRVKNVSYLIDICQKVNEKEIINEFNRVVSKHEASKQEVFGVLWLMELCSSDEMQRES